MLVNKFRNFTAARAEYSVSVYTSKVRDVILYQSECCAIPMWDCMLSPKKQHEHLQQLCQSIV